MLDIMNSQIVIAGETDKVMLVALMIAHEDILAMDRPIVMPPSFGFFNCFAFRVVVDREGDMMLLQIAQHSLLPLGDRPKDVLRLVVFFIILHAKLKET